MNATVLKLFSLFKKQSHVPVLDANDRNILSYVLNTKHSTILTFLCIDYEFVCARKVVPLLECIANSPNVGQDFLLQLRYPWARNVCGP